MFFNTNKIFLHYCVIFQTRRWLDHPIRSSRLRYDLVRNIYGVQIQFIKRHIWRTPFFDQRNWFNKKRMCVGEVILTFIRDTLENRRKSAWIDNFDQKSLIKFFRAQFLELLKMLRNKPHFILGKPDFPFFWPGFPFSNFYDCLLESSV